MIKNKKNKINYNLLNLPHEITRNSEVKATYAYLADGTKLAVMADTIAAGATVHNGFDYLGSMVYKTLYSTRTLESTDFGGGRINRTNTGSYEITYFITDHLGSTRVITNNIGEIKEQNDYYPFGMRHSNANLMLSANRWQFNGKEKQTTGNINYMDYGARMYDDFTGRWFVIDPLQEKYYPVSAYAYCINNPLLFVDPDGKRPRIYIQSKGLGHAFVTVGEGNKTIVYSYGRYGAVGSSGLTSGRFTPKGEGVLYKMSGDDAKKYLNSVLKEGDLSIYTINNANDHAVADFYDQQWAKGTRPSDEEKASYDDENAKVVDEYSLLSNNCVTKTIDGINNDNPIIDSQDRIDAGTTYDGINYYSTIKIKSPNELKNYLDKKIKINPNIIKIDDPQKFIQELQKQLNK